MGMLCVFWIFLNTVRFHPKLVHLGRRSRMLFAGPKAPQACKQTSDKSCEGDSISTANLRLVEDCLIKRCNRWHRLMDPPLDLSARVRRPDCALIRKISTYEIPNSNRRLGKSENQTQQANGVDLGVYKKFPVQTALQQANNHK